MTHQTKSDLALISKAQNEGLTPEEKRGLCLAVAVLSDRQCRDALSAKLQDYFGAWYAEPHHGGRR